MLCSRQFWETDSGLPFLRVAKLSPPLDIGYPRSLRLLIPPSFVAFAASTRLDTQPAVRHRTCAAHISLIACREAKPILVDILSLYPSSLHYVVLQNITMIHMLRRDPERYGAMPESKNTEDGYISWT